MLHPYLLPSRELARLRGWTPSTGAARSAQASLLATIDRGEQLARIPYSERMARLTEASKRAEKAEVTSEAWERAARAAHAVDEFQYLAESMSDALHSLIALEALSIAVDRATLLARMNSDSWGTKLEVLCRWLWMASHQQLISSGVTPENPFNCEVAARGTLERASDREYHQLLHFLHALKKFHGIALLPESKAETPDFIVVDDTGARVGIEVGEAPMSQSWANEQDQAELVFRGLRPLVTARKIVFTFEFPTHWPQLASNLEAFLQWADAEITTCFAAGGEQDAVFGPTGDRFSLRKGRSGLILVSLSDGMGTQEIEQATAELAAGIRVAIRKKIFKTMTDGSSKVRKPPSIRPCYLVLYPNRDMGPELDQACELVKNRPAIQVGSHFDSVWLCDERFIDQLY